MDKKRLLELAGVKQLNEAVSSGNMQFFRKQLGVTGKTFQRSGCSELEVDNMSLADLMQNLKTMVSAWKSKGYLQSYRITGKEAKIRFKKGILKSDHSRDLRINTSPHTKYPILTTSCGFSWEDPEEQWDWKVDLNEASEDQYNAILQQMQKLAFKLMEVGHANGKDFEDIVGDVHQMTITEMRKK